MTSAFRRKKSGSLLSWCRDCFREFHRAYNRSYFQRERERYRRNRLERQRKIRFLIAGMKHNKRCGDCGIVFPYFLLEYDHVRGSKAFRVGAAQQLKFSHARLLDEIAKCELVCVNCHRRRTYVRKFMKTGGPAGKRLARTAAGVLRALKRRSRCVDCKVRHPYFLLDLDHLRDKTLALSRLVSSALSMRTLRAELAKCEVVCANCHRARTFMRRFDAADPTLLALWEVLAFAPVGRVRAVG